MDRDYLSSPRVVAASKDFVCARLLTYENAEEAKVLTSFFVGRSGDLENTTAIFVAADGKTPLTRGGRSPGHLLGGPFGASADALAERMAELAKEHPAKAEAARESPLLPYLVDVRRGLDTAACDLLPLVIVIAKDEAARTALEAPLRPLAWADARRGRLLWAPAAAPADLKAVEGLAADARLVVVQPDAFGLKGKVLAQTSDASPKALEKALDDGLAKHQATAKDAREHMAAGRRAGIDWKTEIPDTDPGPAGAPPPGSGRPK